MVPIYETTRRHMPEDATITHKNYPLDTQQSTARRVYYCQSKCWW